MKIVLLNHGVKILMLVWRVVLCKYVIVGIAYEFCIVFLNAKVVKYRECVYLIKVK